MTSTRPLPVAFATTVCAAALALGISCAMDGPSLDGLRFACSSSADCLEGFVCSAGECARAGGADASVGTYDAEVADTGIQDRDRGDAGGSPDAREGPVDLCSPDAGVALCEAHGRECGTAVLTDPCGRPRAVDCGTCAGPQTCGAVQPNVCD